MKRSFLVVLNPFAGRRRASIVFERVRAKFTREGIDLDVRVTESTGHAREIAKTAALQDYSGLCVVGGDGTAHEVVDGLMQRPDGRKLPLGFISAGTGNTIHQHLESSDPAEGARQMIAGETCPLDVAHVKADGSVFYSLAIIGWGAISDINCIAERMRFLGKSRYALATLIAMGRARPRAAKLILDGTVIETGFLFVVGCNTKFAAEGMRLAPRAEIDDGKIDVVVLRSASKRQMLTLFRRVFDGSHTSLGYVDYHQVRSFAIESEGHEVVDLDGEITPGKSLYVRMIPSALSVFHSTLSEQRQ